MIELNKVYTDGDYFRTPVSIRGNLVSYWVTEREPIVGKEEQIGCMELEIFEKTHNLYVKTMTFQRIKNEGIKNLMDASGEIREVIGFSSNNKLVVFREDCGASSWFEEGIKDWKVVE